MTVNDANRIDESPLPLEVVFDLLAEPRRRYVLYYLRHRHRPVPVDELHAYVTERENRARATGRAQSTPELDLRRTELPRLVAAGVVEFDRGLDLVRLRPNVRPLDEYLHLAESHDSVVG